MGGRLASSGDSGASSTAAFDAEFVPGTGPLGASATETGAEDAGEFWAGIGASELAWDAVPGRDGKASGEANGAGEVC